MLIAIYFIGSFLGRSCTHVFVYPINAIGLLYYLKLNGPLLIIYSLQSTSHNILSPIDSTYHNSVFKRYDRVSLQHLNVAIRYTTIFMYR